MNLPAARRPKRGRGLVLAVGLAACVTSASASDAVPSGTPYLPRADSEVLQKVLPASDPMVRAIEALRTKLAADPGNAGLADSLAHAYIDLGRRQGDAHYAGYAEAVIAPFLRSQPTPAPALVTQATILQYRHEFAPARALLKEAIAREPRQAQAWLSLATLDMVQGDPAGAADDCAQVARHGGFALGLACSGNLRLYTGRAQQGIALLAQLEGDAPSLSPAFKAWIQGLLAEGSERLGQWSQAEAHYRRALRFAPQDNYLLVAYADFLLDRGRPKEVLVLLDPYAESDTAYLRLALAHAAQGDAESARFTWIMAARFAAYALRGSELFGREQARAALYLSRDPQAALVLAQRNFERQREPWDVRILLEAAYAAKQPRAAAPALAFLARTELQDPIIDAVAGRLRAALAEP